MFLFNVRVYGILVNEKNEVLISDERVGNFAFTKFPGGGLENGEGMIDALKREYVEECDFEIEVVRHIYTTDFYEKSSFNESQIISVYYQVRPVDDQILNSDNKIFASTGIWEENNPDKEQHFRLIPVQTVTDDMLTFKTDKIAWQVFNKSFKK